MSANSTLVKTLFSPALAKQGRHVGNSAVSQSNRIGTSRTKMQGLQPFIHFAVTNAFGSAVRVVLCSTGREREDEVSGGGGYEVSRRARLSLVNYETNETSVTRSGRPSRSQDLIQMVYAGNHTSNTQFSGHAYPVGDRSTEEQQPPFCVHIATWEEHEKSQ